eukprot:2012917-Amphidinium_carterae.1
MMLYPRKPRILDPMYCLLKQAPPKLRMENLSSLSSSQRTTESSHTTCCAAVAYSLDVLGGSALFFEHQRAARN